MKIHAIAASLALALSLGGCAQMGDEKTTISMEEHSAETLRLKRRIADLESQLAESRKANANLQAENAELEKRIEMLKVLDQAVEEKRKSYNKQ